MNSLRLDAGMRMEPNILGGGTGSTTTTKERKTVRLQLELFQTNSNRCPEFNYSKLVHLEKKKQKLLKQKLNGVDDGFEDHDEVARIAKELEKKYGASYGRSRGRNKKDEASDIGKGYDESDSFIDNTEAYDEMVPEEVEPIEGGFYINCGALEFKNLHQESMTTKTDEIIKMPNRSKRRLLSTSEESSSSDDDEDDDDEEDEEDDSENEMDTKSNDASEKRSKTLPPKVDGVKSLETEQKKDKLILISGSSSNSPKPIQEEIGSDSDKDRARQKTVKTTTVKDMLKAKRDSFLKSQVGASSSGIGIEGKSINGEIKVISSTKGEVDTSTEDSENSSESSDSDDQDTSEQDQKMKKPTTIITTTTTTTTTTSTTNDENTEKLRSTDTNLPALDVEVTTHITEFKEVVKSRNMLGKKFQFDENLTEVFLKIDEALLCLDKPQRNMVFAHLEYHLLLPKYYFLRKAKQLRIKEEKLKGQRALMKLRRAVIEAMPGVIACYEMEMRKFRELQAANVNNDHPLKEPKKKFPWNSALRNLLYEVYQVRWTSFPVLGTRKETLEEFLIGYMRDKVVEIWPNGWMRYEELQREIEKRKNSSKKDKKKNNLEGISLPNSILGIANTNSTSSSIPVSISMDTANFGKQQFHDPQLQANFEAAAGASSILPQMKRKASDSNRQKNKIQKTYGEQQQLQIYPSSIITNQDNNKTLITAAGSALNPMDGYSQSKKGENNLQSVTSSMSPSTSFSPIQQQQMQLQSAQQQSPQSQPKHSNSNVPKPAHVIDLDKYRSTSDILQTSKQMLSAAAIATIKATSKRNAPLKLTPEAKQYDSSSESDCVEIVDVFPAKPSSSTMSKPKSKKQQNANSINSSYQHNTVPNSFPMDHHSAASMYPTPMALLKNPAALQGLTGSSTINNNNNNSNSNNNNINNNSSSNNSKRNTNGAKMQNFDMAKTMQAFEDMTSFKKNMNMPMND